MPQVIVVWPPDRHTPACLAWKVWRNLLLVNQVRFLADTMPSGDAPSEIPKIEAARRQLDEAIRLWLEGRDPLAVHTLTMAAFGILYHLARHHGVLNDDDPLTDFLSRFGHKQFRELANFLKHADTDPTASYLEPPIREHEWRMGLALVLYRQLA